MPKETFHALNKEKKERIVEGLIHAFNDKQYDAVTVSDIIKACKIPRGSFYQYFDDKFDAFMMLLEVIKDMKMAYLKNYTHALGKEPLLYIYSDLVKGGLAFAKDHPKLYSLGMMLFSSQSEAVQKVLSEMENMSITMLQELLKVDVAHGLIRDDIDTYTIAKMLYNLNAKDIVYEVMQGKKHDEIFDLIEKVLRIIKYGVVKGRDDENNI